MKDLLRKLVAQSEAATAKAFSVAGSSGQLIDLAANCAATSRELIDLAAQSEAEDAAQRRKRPSVKIARTEADTFNVTLKRAGIRRIEIFAAVRAITGYGIKEAKALVDEASDEAPVLLGKGISKAEAFAMMAKFCECSLDSLQADNEFADDDNADLEYEWGLCSR